MISKAKRAIKKEPLYQLRAPRLQIAIRSLGLTQEQAAAYLGVSTQTVNGWAAGSRQPPPKVWLALAKLRAEMREARAAAMEVTQQKLADLEKMGVRAAEIDIDLPARPGGAAWPSADCAETIRAAVYLDYIDEKEETGK